MEGAAVEMRMAAVEMESCSFEPHVSAARLHDTR